MGWGVGVVEITGKEGYYVVDHRGEGRMINEASPPYRMLTIMPEFIIMNYGKG